MEWRDWKAVAEAYRAGWCAVSRSRWFGVSVSWRESYQEATEMQRQGEELAVLVPLAAWQRLCWDVAGELDRRDREAARREEEHRRELESLRERARELLKAKEREKAALEEKAEKAERTAGGLREAVARWKAKAKAGKAVREDFSVPDDAAVEERYDGKRLVRTVRTDFPWDMPAEKVWELTPLEDPEGRKLKEIRRRGKSVWLAVYG